MSSMDDMHGAMAIVGGVIGGLLLFSAMLLGGLRLVRWLGLPQDVPEGAHYSPPAPPLRAAGNPAEARAIATLQARRRALYARARAIRAAADPEDPTAGARVGAADACIAAATLSESSLLNAEELLAGLER